MRSGHKFFEFYHKLRAVRTDSDKPGTFDATKHRPIFSCLPIRIVLGFWQVLIDKEVCHKDAPLRILLAGTFYHERNNSVSDFSTGFGRF